MKIRIHFFLALLALAGCSGREEQDSFQVEKSAEKGPIKAMVRLQHEDMSILDTQRLMLEIIAPAGISLGYPSLSERLEDFRQVPWRSDDEQIESGTQRIRKYFAFELYESGEQVIPPFEIRYSSGSGAESKEGSFRTPALSFKIKALAEGQAWKQELAPPAGLIRPDPQPWLLISALGAAALLLLGVCFVAIRALLRKRRRPPLPPAPAHELAYQELRELVERHKAGALGGEAFAAECSDVLRRYIERRFGIKAPERTTEEFLTGLSEAKDLKAHRAVLQKHLEFTDLVKFATRPVLSADIQQGFDFIRQFIEATREQEAAK